MLTTVSDRIQGQRWHSDAAWFNAQPSGSHPTDSFQYQDFDGLDYSNTVTVTFTINRAPVAVADSFSTPMNVGFTGNVLTNDHDPNGSLLAESVAVTPVVYTGAYGTITIGSLGSFVFAPPLRRQRLPRDRHRQLHHHGPLRSVEHGLRDVEHQEQRSDAGLLEDP